MEEHLPVLWDCFVNSNCKRNPNDPESMRQRDFVELILNDVKFLKPPIRADLEILHKGEASNHPEGKFKFSCFVDAVIKSERLTNKQYQNPNTSNPTHPPASCN